MFAVEVYAAVRRFVMSDGHSRREAARVFGLSRAWPRSMREPVTTIDWVVLMIIRAV